jgi:hypothetical protein
MSILPTIVGQFRVGMVAIRHVLPFKENHISGSLKIL